ncbi:MULTISPECIES: molybdenum cofactor biosynthesis protein MoaE [unclassified Chryseobacterium]|uniref:molybdenum cofactor biosynthesis protein MoaE n=1 Tax=unclassified Chryseobacterium TaxID=2593645 RepID=UPI000D33191F|nr:MULTISPECIES: molybdenum cofactor biosynthesis protein MoaE [unclassified Chryseobacterium]PTT77773.1 molybdopterin converting factor [Chryseobacterium sp. HMWF001]PVV58128.1 molybdenum cofactor biosynthesis protein MoaE [Chryseobacterium sp. HMWF035]
MSKIKNIFQNSPVSPLFIAESITKHSAKTEIGAHQIFLGQIRADEIEGKTVKAIEYTAYEDLALSQMVAIREEIFAKYKLTCMHIHHSLGIVNAGEICLFVFTSSKHRKEATSACNEVVERIKNELPIWGREIFEDETHQWKTNQ